MLWLRRNSEFVATTARGAFTVYPAGGRQFALAFKPTGMHARTRDVGLFTSIGAAKYAAARHDTATRTAAFSRTRKTRTRKAARKTARKQPRRTRGRFGNSSKMEEEEPLVHTAKRAHRAVMVQDMRRALKQGNANLHKLLRQNYFPHIPLTDIYAAVERAGITIDPEERSCILTGRQGRASWPITFHGMPYQQHLWISWYKMEQTGRYEVVGAIT